MKQISNLEDKNSRKHPIRPTKRKRILNKKDSWRDLWDNIKHYNIQIIGVPDAKREQKIDNLVKVMMENFPNLMKKKMDTSPWSTESSKQMNPKRLTPRHTILKMVKIKEK